MMRAKRRCQSVLVGVCLIGLVSACGCWNQTTVKSRYGTARDNSVNGTAVLRDMFERAGHKVRSWSWLSPRLRERAECIVWFPDTFQPPGEEARYWLTDWLAETPNRTLIYVARDFDAAPTYWRNVKPLVPADQQAEAQSRYVEAQRVFELRRNQGLSEDVDCGWFVARSEYRPREVRSLEGDPKWTEGIDPEKLDIELAGRIEPSVYASVLLASEGDALLTEETFGEDGSSRLLVVANGSFLLNVPVVNHEHRKLAWRLIDHVGPPSQRVVFLESQYTDPPIHAVEPSARPPSAMEIFHIWPTNWILPHLAAVGIILCFWQWPILGRIRDEKTEGMADFGRHLDALAALLARSDDRAYARDRLAQYHDQLGKH